MNGQLLNYVFHFNTCSMDAVVQLKDMREGELFIFPLALRDANTGVNIYTVVFNEYQTVCYARPGYPDVHYASWFDGIEVKKVTGFTRLPVPGLDRFSADNRGQLVYLQKFHAYYRDLFAQFFNQLPDAQQYVSGHIPLNVAPGTMPDRVGQFRALCQSLCHYHVWCYTHFTGEIEAFDKMPGDGAVSDQNLKDEL